MCPVLEEAPKWGVLCPQLWGMDIQRLAVLDGSVFLYLRLGVQSVDTYIQLNRELTRAV